MSGLVYFIEGAIEYDFNGNKFTAHAGDIVVFPVDLPYKGKKLTEINEFIVINFQTKPKNALLHFPLPHLVRLPNAEKELLPLFYEMLTVFSGNGIIRNLRTRTLLYQIIEKILSFSGRQTKPLHPLVAKAQGIVAENCDDTIFSASVLAERLHISPSYLRRLFQENLDLSPTEYLIRYRLAKAESLLSNGDFTITDIAERCGFFSAEYFSRIFKKKKGISPREYRKSVLS